MRLVWRQEALDDREEILQHISLDNPDAAVDLDEIFELKGERARQRPFLYRRGIAGGTREIVATPNYTIKDDFVEILRVVHTKRRWP